MPESNSEALWNSRKVIFYKTYAVSKTVCFVIVSVHSGHRWCNRNVPTVYLSSSAYYAICHFIYPAIVSGKVNFRGIKSLEHGMKMFEKILERRLRKLITVNNMQFGFSPGKGTTDAVFIILQLQEKHLEVHRDLFLTFVDLEKAYDRVPRDLVYWCLRRRGVPEKLVRLVEATYHGASTVRTTLGRTEEFPIKVGLHQGPGLSPFLFIVVLDVISEEFRCGLPNELLFADDLAVVTDTEEEMQRRWLGWQIGMESKGLKVNIGKMEVMVSSRKGTKVNIKDSQGTSLRQVNKLKYLGVTISEEGGSEEAVRARVSAAWGKWRDISGVISDKNMPRN